jgi:hypothetical protein
MTPPAVTLRHAPEELDGKSIRFRIRSYAGEPVQEQSAEGNGILFVFEASEEGRFEAFIDVSSFPDHPSHVGVWETHQIPLTQQSADCLKIESDGTLLCVDPSLPSSL